MPYFPDIFDPQQTFTWTGGEDIPISATVSNDGTCYNEFVILYEETTDAAHSVPPSPGMDYDPLATLESSTVLLSQELVDEDSDTWRITCAALRDPDEQGVHLSPEEAQEDTAKPIASVAIFPKNTNFKFITKISTGLIKADDDNAINFVLNADTVFPDPVYLKRWKPLEGSRQSGCSTT